MPIYESKLVNLNFWRFYENCIFYFHNNNILVFNDTRRFGYVTIETEKLLYQNKFLKLK